MARSICFLIFVLQWSLVATAAHRPIAAVRELAEGETVMVIGEVTVPSGLFRSSSDDHGFAMQDETGGIWVSTKDDLSLRLNQVVAVTGVLRRKAGKLQIVPPGRDSVTVATRRELRVPTGEVGPATMGRLITVEGRVESVAADLPYGHKIDVDDGSGRIQVFVNASTGIDVRARHFETGRRIRVTGFASQYETTYEIEPRSRRDVRPAD